MRRRNWRPPLSVAEVPDRLVYFDGDDWHPDDAEALRLHSAACAEWCKANRVRPLELLVIQLSIFPVRRGGRLAEGRTGPRGR